MMRNGGESVRGYRHDVGMIAVWDRRGHLTPLSLIWDDGTRYRIDAILERREVVLEHEGSACVIAPHRRDDAPHLLCARAWFVEAAAAEKSALTDDLMDNIMNETGKGVRIGW